MFFVPLVVGFTSSVADIPSDNILYRSYREQTNRTERLEQTMSPFHWMSDERSQWRTSASLSFTSPACNLEQLLWTGIIKTSCRWSSVPLWRKFLWRCARNRAQDSLQRPVPESPNTRFRAEGGKHGGGKKGAGRQETTKDGNHDEGDSNVSCCVLRRGLKERRHHPD